MNQYARPVLLFFSWHPQEDDKFLFPPRFESLTDLERWVSGYGGYCFHLARSTSPSRTRTLWAELWIPSFTYTDFPFIAMKCGTRDTSTKKGEVHNLAKSLVTTQCVHSVLLEYASSLGIQSVAG